MDIPMPTRLMKFIARKPFMNHLSVFALISALLLSSCASSNQESVSSSGTQGISESASSSGTLSKRSNRKPIVESPQSVKAPDIEKQKEFVEKSRKKLESLIMMGFDECGSKKHETLVRELEGAWKNSGGNISNGFSIRVSKCKIRAAARESKPCEATFSAEREISECKRLSDALSVVRKTPPGDESKSGSFAVYAQYFGNVRDFPPEKFASPQ